MFGFIRLELADLRRECAQDHVVPLQQAWAGVTSVSQVADSKGGWACRVKVHKTQPMRVLICLKQTMSSPGTTAETPLLQGSFSMTSSQAYIPCDSP